VTSQSQRLAKIAAVTTLFWGAVTSCASDVAGGSRIITTVDTTNGVVHVLNAGTPSTWALDPVTVIGNIEEGPDAFGRVMSFVADADLNIYVADVFASEIRVFDPSGRHLRTFGRKGAGPGEIGSPYSLGWVGDSLAVHDLGNARIGLFSPVGDWMGQWRAQSITGPEIRLRQGSPGDLYGFAGRRINDQFEVGYHHLSAAGSGDTIPFPESPHEQPTGPLCESRQATSFQAITFFGIPFGARHRHTPGPDNTIAAAWTPEYRIAFLDTDGDTVRVVEREYVHQPISDAEWEEGTREWREFREEHPGADCNPSRQARPATKPAIRHFFFDSSGRMWVESYAASGTTAFDVFDPTGRLLGSMPVPPRDTTVWPYVEQDRLMVVTKDSLDVPYVNVFRIVMEGSE
jgi:hypothetical protein